MLRIYLHAELCGIVNQKQPNVSLYSNSIALLVRMYYRTDQITEQLVWLCHVLLATMFLQSVPLYKEITSSHV